MITAEPIVSPTPYGAEPPARPRQTGLLFIIGAAMLTTAVLVASFVHLPYMALAPGSATPVSDLFAAPPDRSFPPRGHVYLTTVSIIGLPHGDKKAGLLPLEALRGWLDSDIDVLPEEVLTGGTPADKVIEQNAEQMTDSQQVAKVVALRRLGYPVAEHGEGGRVLGVAPDAPAAARLRAQDIIVGVDDANTETASQIISQIQRHAPGETVRFIVVREGSAERRVVEVPVGDRSADGLSCYLQDTVSNGDPCIGVALGTKNRTFDFPYEVTIDAGRIGGPSAGLAFTLGLLDYLTPGELTGGNEVAVTGTIDLDGRVGDVGGVAQKTAAAIARGVRYFLVPPGEYEAARKRAGTRLKVIRVATVDEALAALDRIGGDVSALGPPVGGPQG